nr:discoidin domain-containing protein [Rarobacter incanus]
MNRVVVGGGEASSTASWTVVSNATDGDVGTFWGAAEQWSQLSVPLTGATVIDSVTVALSPDAAWEDRTQSFGVQARLSGGDWVSVAAEKSYSFSALTGNYVTIPVASFVGDEVRLVFTGNSSVNATGGQVAELRVFGDLAPETSNDARGADMSYVTYEAEDGELGGGAQAVGPNRTVGDLAGEASGRRAVTLDTTGAYVQWTLTEPTDTIVGRFSIPDSADGKGRDGSIDVYADGEFVVRLALTSKYSWQYGDETNPTNNPSDGAPRHIYDEAHTYLPRTIPAGATLTIKRTEANPLPVTVDLIDTEMAQFTANPDTSKYVQPAGFTQQDIQAAIDKVAGSDQYAGVYLPPGDYTVDGTLWVWGRAMDIVGAGPWFTLLHAPTDQINTNATIGVASAASGTQLRGFSYWGNYVERIDGPGKAINLWDVSDVTIDNVWLEHAVCGFWGTNIRNVTIQNSRIRNMFADGVNMTNGSTSNTVRNVAARTTGDDSFALFSATDGVKASQTGNTYENLTALLPWRAAGLAVYGGGNNTFRNIYVADTLAYSGVTVSSENFGYSMDGFGVDGSTVFSAITIERAGGHFWGSQTFGAIWLYASQEQFQNVEMSDITITDPTYAGITVSKNTAANQDIRNVTLTNVTITGAQLSGDAWNDGSGRAIWVKWGATGAMTLTNLTMSNNNQEIANDAGESFVINRN